MNGWELFALLNTNFFSAGFGALFGALAAAFLAVRSEKRRRLHDEIAACNVALGLCASIANAFVAVKRQSVNPTVNLYREQQLALQAVIQAGSPGIAPIHTVHFDLKTVPSVWVAIDALNASISDRIGSTFEPAALAASLTLAVHNQDRVTNLRNDFIEKFRSYPEGEKVQRYFGLSLPGGHLDQSYPDLIEGLKVYTDDCIYFSTLLADVIARHGLSLGSRLGNGAPIIKRCDFTQALADGVMPDTAHYPAFEKQFRLKAMPEQGAHPVLELCKALAA